MNEVQRQYFDRQMKLDTMGEMGQQKLLEAKVLVIGAGGLGCSVISALARAGVGHLTIVDHDRVEMNNLHRQILFTPEDIGKLKAQVANERAQEMAPWIESEYWKGRFDQTNAEDFFNDHDVIVDCTDHLATKFFIHDFAFKKKTNLAQSSIHKYDGQLQVFAFAKHQEKGCMRCLWNEQPEQLGDCNDNGVMGVVPGFFGMLQANEVIKLLVGMNSLKSNEMVTFDLINLSVNKLKFPKNDECRFCVHQEEMPVIKIEVAPNEIDFEDFVWIDIRKSTRMWDLPKSIPINQLIDWAVHDLKEEIDKLPKDKQIVVLCDAGVRSLTLAHQLRELGYENSCSLIGGHMALKEF